MKFLFVLAYVAILAFASVQGVDYCQLKCIYPWDESGNYYYVDNIACNKTLAFGSTCVNPKAYDFSEPNSSQRQAILHSHNLKRNKIAGGDNGLYPIATRMLTMKWDPEFAKLAHYNVKECIGERDQCHITSTYKKPGQNGAFFWFEENEVIPAIDDLIERAIVSWENTYALSDDPVQDIKMFSDEDSSAAPSARLVIDDNVAVGCAVATYMRNTTSIFAMICNYAKDVTVGEPLYQYDLNKGAVAGSKCTKININYPNLCDESDTDRQIEKFKA